MIKDRADLINYYIEDHGFINYLEIGVFDGENIRKIKAAHKDGVDPGSEGKMVPEVNFKMTSDEFFLLIKGFDIYYDIIFIDGLHHSEQVDRDIANSLEHLVTDGIIVLHDCNPPTEGHAAVPRQQSEWNGDVYKSIIKFRYEGKYPCWVYDMDWGLGVIYKREARVKNISYISEEQYERGISDWEYFDKNRGDLLGLINNNNILDDYTSNRNK